MKTMAELSAEQKYRKELHKCYAKIDKLTSENKKLKKALKSKDREIDRICHKYVI